MDSPYLFIALIAFASGVAARPNLESLWYRLFPAPKRMRVTRFDTVTPAVTVEPAYRLPMWITRTHAYITRGEMCERTPFNVREMRELTGLSSRQQRKYMDVLENGRIVEVVPSGGVRWMVPTKRGRRVKLNHLPYPTDFDPPDFSHAYGVTVATGRDGTERSVTA